MEEYEWDEAALVARLARHEADWSGLEDLPEPHDPGCACEECMEGRRPYPFADADEEANDRKEMVEDWSKIGRTLYLEGRGRPDAAPKPE